jgi:hypothetical protein
MARVRMFLPTKKWCAALVFLLLVSACSGASKQVEGVQSESAAAPIAAAPSETTAPATPSRKVSPFSMADSQPFALRSQGLTVRLPNGQGWTSLPARGGFTGLAHAESRSEIWVRHSPARRTVKLAECEEQSRQSLTLLRHGESPAFERRLIAPAGYGGVVNVILSSGGGGLVEAFGVGVSRCLAVVFITADGPGFPERLQVATNEILDSLALPALDERGGGREPLAL